MIDVLEINKGIFGTNIRKGGISRRAKKAMAIPIEISVGEEMTYEDCQVVDGGGNIRLGVKFSIGAVVGSTVVSSIVGFLSGYCVSKAMKFGSMIGGFWGGVVGLVAGALVSMSIAKIINNAVYSSTGGPQEVTLIDINTGFFSKSFSYYYDLGNLLGIVIGGGTGFGAGFAYGTQVALATA